MVAKNATGTILLSAILSSFPFTVLHAQISPGELSAPHAGLEGLGKCTSCHVLGKTIDDRRCLNCHVELDRRISAGKGYHAKLRDQACIQCHKEHHGRDFPLIRWDEKAFDHSVTGFDLLGKHRGVECRKCHSPARIKDAIAKTFLGLSRECATCHNDPHAGKLGAQCLKCHVNDAWKPASGFSHERTKFPLTGRHQAVPCESCHHRPGPPGTAVRYTGLAYKACVDCHRDPHAGKFRQPCNECHTTQGWELGGKNFDHAATRFPLRGKHALVACARCHRAQPGAHGSPSRFAVARFSRCVDCHVDPHRQQFVNGKTRGECGFCHSEQGWKPAVLAGFDHNTTRFPLRGKHDSVACAICHVPQQRYPSNITKVDIGSFSKCADCHRDVHGGQFSSRSDGGKCESCHRETGFQPSTYLLSAHADARFPLDGAHEAVACDRCHTVASADGNQVRLFRWEKVPVCETCHRDVHRGEFAALRVDGCATCHTTRAWAGTQYDHSRTGFRLDGKHLSVPCAGCHRKGGEGGSWRFRGTPKECAGCHNNVGEG